MKERASRFELITTLESARQAYEIADVLTESHLKQGRAKSVSISEAIRYAITFTHKQLTEVLNPEDLRDDDLS